MKFVLVNCEAHLYRSSGEDLLEQNIMNGNIYFLLIDAQKIGTPGFGGQCWDRTNSLFDVNEALYH